MSVAIVSAETTAKIADLIYRVTMWGFEQEHFDFSERAKNYIKSIWEDIDGEREEHIYKALRDLNRNSYNTRYKECDVDPFVDYPFEHKKFKYSEGFYKHQNGPEDFQKLKSCQFFKYQCIEHDESPEVVEMYNVLEEIVNGVKDNIVMNAFEWRQAKWE